MIKPTSSFKLSKEVKRRMATIVDAQARGVFKRSMIQAQLEAEEAQRMSLKKKAPGDDSAD